MESMKGKLDGGSFRVPVPTGSITDFTANLKKAASVGAINEAFAAAAKKELKGVLRYTDEPIVSSDIVGDAAFVHFRLRPHPELRQAGEGVRGDGDDRGVDRLAEIRSASAFSFCRIIAEISGGENCSPPASTRASPFGAGDDLVGDDRLLLAHLGLLAAHEALDREDVFCGLVTAWRLATVPTRRSPRG